MSAAARRPLTFLCTAAALLAFAANSLLCRAALGDDAIDAASFTVVRLCSGAVTLAALVALRTRRRPPSAGTWSLGLALFAYAAPFSFAYLRLPTGLGALVLFGTVQTTMIGAEVARGRRPSRREALGLFLALGGLAALTIPGTSAPDPLGFGLMVVAGTAWGFYSLRGRDGSLRGRGTPDPLATTAGNFARSLPFALLLAPLAVVTPLHATGAGLALAIASGALASGVGYALWYAALPALGATRAAIVQLLVPVLAAAAGVLVLGETVSPRLVACGLTILAGVALALRRR